MFSGGRERVHWERMGKAISDQKNISEKNSGIPKSSLTHLLPMHPFSTL